MTITLLPSSELVAVAWLATLPGITSSMVGTTLPADTSTWATNGFLTVTTAGGTPGLEVPIRSPLVQVDVWAVKVGAQRPPWGHADQLAQKVVAGCYGATSGPRNLTLHAGPSTGTAVLRAAWATMEPQRLYGDDSSYARFRLDIRLDWS